MPQRLFVFSRSVMVMATLAFARWSPTLVRLACILCLSMAATSHAELDPKEPIYAGCPVAEEPTERVTLETLLPLKLDWYLLSPARASRQACLLEACDADRKVKEATLAGPSMPLWYTVVAVTFALGVGAGTGLGWLLESLKP